MRKRKERGNFSSWQRKGRGRRFKVWGLGNKSFKRHVSPAVKQSCRLTAKDVSRSTQLHAHNSEQEE